VTLFTLFMISGSSERLTISELSLPPAVSDAQ